MILRKGYTFIFENTKFKIFFVDRSHKIYHCHEYKTKNKYRFSFWYDNNGVPYKIVPLKQTKIKGGKNMENENFLGKYGLDGKNRKRLRLMLGLSLSYNDLDGFCLHSKFGNKPNPIGNWKKKKISFELAKMLVMEVKE